jgi:hypothetical protein
MNFRALFVIAEDPRRSGRPAEALRVAAGLSVWKKVDVAVYLRGAAAQLLDAAAEGFVDEENFARYWPILAENGAPIYAQSGAPGLPPRGLAAVPFEEISDAQWAALAAARDCVLRF